MFAVELMLLSVNAANLLPVSLATVVAIWLSRLVEGRSPLIDIPELMVHAGETLSVWIMLLFVPLGILVGLLSALFIWSLDKAEDLFAKIPGGYYVQHVFGMFLLGLMIYALWSYAGHYFVEGVGYASITQILKTILADPVFLLMLMVFKLVATCLTSGFRRLWRCLLAIDVHGCGTRRGVRPSVSGPHTRSRHPDRDLRHRRHGRRGCRRNRRRS